MTLEYLTDFLEKLDNTDAAIVGVAIGGFVSPVNARQILNVNQQLRADYLDRAFRAAHAATHAKKCLKALGKVA